MKLISTLILATTGLALAMPASAECYQQRRTGLGTAVAPFCDQRPVAQRQVQVNLNVGRGSSRGRRTAAPRTAPRRAVIIPQAQPEGGYRCEIGGKTGWCVD